MEFFLLIKKESFGNMGIFLLSLILAISGVYSTKFFSILLPLFASGLFITQKGWQHIKIYLPGLAVFFLLILGWSGLSLLWTINLGAGLKSFFSLGATLFFSYIFLCCVLQGDSNFIQRAYKLLMLSALFLAVVVVFQSYMDAFNIKGLAHPSYLLKPSASILGLFGFGACAFLWAGDKKTLSIISFVFIGLLLTLTTCQTAIYAYVFASCVFALSYAMPFWTTRLAMLGSYTLLLLTPILHAYIFLPVKMLSLPYYFVFLTNSFFHRLLAWEFYAHKFFERPFLGWGISSSRYLFEKPELLPGYENTIHPHKAIIQAYVELGIFGGVLVSFFVAYLFWLVEKHVKDRLAVAVCNATIVFGLILADMTHSLWANYWLSLCVLAAGSLLLFIKYRAEQKPAKGGRLKPILAPA